MFEKLAEDIYNATMYKLACYAKEMEKTAGRTYKDVVERLFDNVTRPDYKKAWNASKDVTKQIVDKAVPKFTGDPLVTKQLLARAIDEGAATTWGGQLNKNVTDRISGNLKALLFNKHKDMMPDAIRKFTESGLGPTPYNLQGASHSTLNNLYYNPIDRNGRITLTDLGKKALELFEKGQK